MKDGGCARKMKCREEEGMCLGLPSQLAVHTYCRPHHTNAARSGRLVPSQAAAISVYRAHLQRLVGRADDLQGRLARGYLAPPRHRACLAELRRVQGRVRKVEARVAGMEASQDGLWVPPLTPSPMPSTPAAALAMTNDRRGQRGGDSRYHGHERFPEQPLPPRHAGWEQQRITGNKVEQSPASTGERPPWR